MLCFQVFVATQPRRSPDFFFGLRRCPTTSYSPYTLPSSVCPKSCICHSCENCRGVYQQFPFRNSQLFFLPSTNLDAGVGRSFRTVHRACPFRCNTYEKQGGGGQLLLTRFSESSKECDQYAIGPTSFSTSAISTMTMASHGQPSRKHPSGPLLRHFLHPMHWMGSIWMRPNGGLSSSGTQNMQSSTGQYSTQAGDPAQPVQHSVMTASSFGFFLRANIIPLERGSCLSSSGTIPGALTTSGALAISRDFTLSVKPLPAWFFRRSRACYNARCNPFHLRPHTCSPSHLSDISHRLCWPDLPCASSSFGISLFLPGIQPITKSLPATGCTTTSTASIPTGSFFPRMPAPQAIPHSSLGFISWLVPAERQSCSRKPSSILPRVSWPRASPLVWPRVLPARPAAALQRLRFG